VDIKTNLWVAFGLLLVIEGLLLFLAPALLRQTFRRMVDLTDGQLRFVGLASMLGGTFLLYLMHSA
jgi:uncharacterized protein YjeT (DUF2065 family)